MKRRAFSAAAAASASAWLAGCAADSPWWPQTPEADASPVSPAVLPTPLPGSADGAAPVSPAPALPSAPVPTPAADDPDRPPPAPREFRGAWVASVNNIDWPSRPGLPAEAQRAEALALLDRARVIGLNALILQVRPAGDALYPSTLEPWSEYLTGAQGRPPAPWYDPLAFWIAEAHRRGLELHAWFNPYRARHPSARTPLAAPHLAVLQPQVVRTYGDMLWMDPGEPAAMAQTLAVVADVVRRYDIDGVHIDDYFYPYPVKQGEADLPFPDAATQQRFPRYGSDGALLSPDDWRRANVDALVNALYRTVHQIKPWVQVGISPFGIGRPERRPPGITGFSQYDKLYADVEGWLERGWLDYLAPQLYWPIAREGQQFALLLDGWVAENHGARHLWPGLFTSQVRDLRKSVAGKRARTAGTANWPAQELLDQVALLRSRRAQVGGHIHFSMIALQQDRDGVATRLRAGAYAQPALVPATPWLHAVAPAAPALRAAGREALIEPAAGATVTRWALWRRRAGRWDFEVLPEPTRRMAVDGAEALALAGVGRAGALGPATLVRLPLP